MPTENPLPAIDQNLVGAIAERVADVVYARLRADVCMGDDMVVTEEEAEAILHKHPTAMATWKKIHVGPQFVNIPGSRKRHYRIGAIKHFLHEVKAGPMHATPFLEAQARLERERGRPTAAG